MNENNPLTSLPGEIIQDHLGPCLTGIEIIGLSETCRRLYRQFNVDSVWREKTRLEGLKISPQIERIAKRFRDENYPETDSEDCIPAPSLAKLQYLVARMIQRNILQNNFRRETISFGSPGKVCCSENILVCCAEGRMLVWDTSELWTSVTNTSMEKRPFSLVSQTFHTEVNLAISDSVLLLCFSYSQEEGGEEYFQHIAAHHLENNLKLLWEKSGPLGGHLHTVKIINDNLFIFDFIADCIEVYRITEESLERETSLGPISSVGRITCDWVSASRRHLVAPGWSDHSGPLVSSWDRQTGAATTLRPDRPTCPYRSFRATAISGENILGLLDRLRLHCWAALTGNLVFTVDLTNTGLRDNMDQVWLEVSPHFTLTVHQDLTSITVVSDQGKILTSLVPVLPPHHQHQHWRVQEVVLRHTVVFVRLSSEGPDTSRRGLILHTDLTSLLLRPGQGSSSSTPATVVAESDWRAAGPGSTMFLHDTKLISVNTHPLQIQVFNYLDPQRPDY